MNTGYTAVPLLLTAAIAAVLSLVVFYHGPGRRTNRALAAHLLTLAAISGGYAMAAVTEGASGLLSSAWTSGANALINMSILFGIALAMSWPARREWTPEVLVRLWPYVTVGILLALGEAALQDPGRGIPIVSLWSGVAMISLVLLGLGLGAAYLLVREAAREERADLRDGRIFMALGLTLTTFHVMPRNLLLLPRYLLVTDGPYLVGSIGTLILFPLAVALLVCLWRIRGSRAARVGVMLVVASMLSGALDSFAYFVVTGSGLVAQAVFGFRFFMYALWRLVPVALLAYVVLRGQVPGLDVKVRWGISRSTIAAAFVAVFFIASEGAQIVFGSEDPWVGLLAAGALVFAIAPLQRAAEGLAAKAVPLTPVTEGVQRPQDPEDTYRRAVRLAMRDRTLTSDEEVHLAELAEALGIGAGRAAAVVRDAKRDSEVGV